MSSHNLASESGRHTNITKENPLCKLCCSDIEDEFYFVFKSPQCKELRLKCIKKYYWEIPLFINLYNY